MNCRAGSLMLAYALTVVLPVSLEARQAWRTRTVPRSSCRLRDMTILTQLLLTESLTHFDDANGHNLGTWHPGFPQLHVHNKWTPDGSRVQCSLIFMAKGLTLILEDQKSNLNPENHSLHKKLKDTIDRVSMLVTCVKMVLGGECLPNPSPPSMPMDTFERKQWGHTLLKAAKEYLEWLKHKVEVRHRDKIRQKVHIAKSRKYFEGSGYLL